MDGRLEKLNKNPEFERFDAAMRKALSVSHEELKRREEEWKRERQKKKKAKPPRTRRASEG
jgi:hypothetical protein